jgi:hypothetical protein
MTNWNFLQAGLANSPGFWALPNFWALLPVALVAFAAWLAHYLTLKRMRHETFVQMERQQHGRKLAALEGCWKLLLYTTDVENGHNLLQWRQPPGGERQYLIHRGQGQRFIKELGLFFYGSGLGIYLPASVKDPLFAYRNILYGFLLKEGGKGDDPVAVQNKEMAAKLLALHQTLLDVLKNETKWVAGPQ